MEEVQELYIEALQAMPYSSKRPKVSEYIFTIAENQKRFQGVFQSVQNG